MKIDEVLDELDVSPDYRKFITNEKEILGKVYFYKTLLSRFKKYKGLKIPPESIKPKLAEKLRKIFKRLDEDVDVYIGFLLDVNEEGYFYDDVKVPKDVGRILFPKNKDDEYSHTIVVDINHFCDYSEELEKSKNVFEFLYYYTEYAYKLFYQWIQEVLYVFDQILEDSRNFDEALSDQESYHYCYLEEVSSKVIYESDDLDIYLNTYVLPSNFPILKLQVYFVYDQRYRDPSLRCTTIIRKSRDDDLEIKEIIEDYELEKEEEKEKDDDF